MALLTFPYATIFDTTGNLEPGALAYFYQAGTSTPLDTYSDASLTSANTNPVVADGAGALGPIYLEAQSYKIVIKDAAGSTIKTIDNYDPIPTGEQILWAGTVGGTANAVLLTTSPLIATLRDGTIFWWRAAAPNTADMTINLDGTGAIPLVWPDGSAMLAGDVPVNAIVYMAYNSNTNTFNLLSNTAGPLFRTQLNGDIVLDGSRNLTSRMIPVQKTADYSLAATDRNKLFSFYITAAPATATCLLSSTAGSGYSVKILNLYASTKVLTIAVASGNGFYHPNGTNSATLTLQPGESCSVYSTGDGYFVLELIRNKTAIQGGFKSLKIVAADGTTAPVVTADQVTVEDAGGRAMRLSGLNVTMNLGTAGAGGLDTGTIAAGKMYFIWAIAKEDGTQSALASLSSTAPSPMPTGYTMMARIGTVVTKQGAATLLGTRQYGRSVQYAQPLTIASGAQGTYSATAPTWAEKTVAANSGASAFVPLTASKIVIIGNGNLGSGTSQYTYAAPNASYGGYQSSNPPPIMAGVVNGAMAFGTFALEATTIQVVGSGTASAVYCLGWDENF